MKPYLADSDLTIYQGDALLVLRELPAESVHCVVTSPPYWGLRDYGTGAWEGGGEECDHQGPPKASDKSGLKNDGRPAERVGQNEYERAATVPFRDECGKCGARRVDNQLGLEATPEEYVARMVEVFREVRRVLRADGTCWLNLGDSYAGSWGNQGRKEERGTQRPINGGMLTPVHDGRYPSQLSNTGVPPPGLKPKDLIGIPWRVAFALQADGWYLRSDIVWSKPNPMPESVTDRPTKSHEYVFLLTKAPRYFYDLEAIRERIKGDGTVSVVQRSGGTQFGDDGKPIGAIRRYAEIKGANTKTVWEIATQPYPEAHFATYPEELVRRCILAGTSERGCCPECGAPWLREIETPDFSEQPKRSGDRWDWRNGDRTSAGQAWQKWRDENPNVTTGWLPSCECGDEPAPIGDVGTEAHDPIPCTVLDPFFGSGTTGLVARKHGRRCIGIELSADYCALAAERLQQLSLFA